MGAGQWRNPGLRQRCSPIPYWKKLSEEKTDQPTQFFNSYLYPLLGLTALATFIGAVINQKENVIELALKSSAVTFVTLFTAFFLSAYLLNKILIKYFNKADNLVKSQLFVGYISSISYVITMIHVMLPELFFIKYALFYMIYIIWIGSEYYLHIDEKKRLSFLIIASILMYATPALLSKVMLMLMPKLS